MLTCCCWCSGALQGLFERHKLIVATQLCMAVLRSKGELQRTKFEFLLRGPKEMGVDNPLGDWVSTHTSHLIQWQQQLSCWCCGSAVGQCQESYMYTETGSLSDAHRLSCCLQVSKSVWGSVQALKELEDYTTLPDDLVGSSKRWREWMELERPGGNRKGHVLTIARWSFSLCS